MLLPCSGKKETKHTALACAKNSPVLITTRWAQPRGGGGGGRGGCGGEGWAGHEDYSGV